MKKLADISAFEGLQGQANRSMGIQSEMSVFNFSDEVEDEYDEDEEDDGWGEKRDDWDDEEQKYYFSVTDVVGVLTEQPDARGASTYWAVLKKRLKAEGANELITNCKQLKLPAADGEIS